MERKAIRVEPYSTYLERGRKAPARPVTVGGGFVFVSGLPPFDPASGELVPRPFAEQADIVLQQMQRCLEAAGSSLDKVVKCNVYLTDPRHFGTFNEAYSRYFVVEPPARIALCVSCFPFPGPFEVEIDCIALG
jgi:2-iminobutanoate/2-iminopropanoate deaminase